MPSKSLLIGLDGAEPKLLKKWADEGHLPTIKGILDRWYHRPVDTPKGFGDGVFWASVVTGVGVGGHGRYFPEQYNPETYQLDRFSLDTDLGREPFWYYCSKAGAHVGIIDLYSSPLRTGLNGIQVMDWMIHDRKNEPRSWPASLIRALEDKYMADPLDGSSEAYERTESQWLKMHSDILDRIRAKTDAAKDMLTGNQWDLFGLGFCDPHDIGHQSWHWHDSACVNHPGKWRSLHGDPVLQTYQALDQSIGELIEAAQAHSVFLVAGLGMDRQSSCNSIIQQVLGHYCGRSGSRAELTERRAQMPYFEIPHNMNAAAIRINLIGRESQGVVEASEYDATCEFLSKKLSLLRDVESGDAIVEDVVKVQKKYRGKYSNRLPDLLVIWKKPLLTQKVAVDDGTQFNLDNVFGAEFRSGDHTDRALFISSRQYQNESVMTESIAPTLCRSIGINLPASEAGALEEIS